MQDGGTVRHHQYLNAHPEAKMVLDFIRANPQGVTSRQMADAFPELGSFDRGVITRKLYSWGFIRKGTRTNEYTVWVAK